ncbi:glycosyltransferase family 2 protein [Photorhabdus temperata]|uniref:glycosyltransferase family 2 protein n=1 Tax=Photorhabdus temperata TaxID=574560 RepID=UPI00038A1A81|nr:glycosyltransferase family 2 protein [Photorhabdus temperata]EQB98224.1 glycosyl transferase family protein [Photorhabdus temperata subsp. temperata M1021]
MKEDSNEIMISIIMPSYNSSNFIGQSIQSVLEQTFSKWELFIIDDCSKDDTIKSVEKFKDERINLISLKVNVGAGKARNIGLRLAKGKYIAFIDSDDLWLPEKLEHQINYMTKNQELAAVCTGYTFINEENKPLRGKIVPDKIITLNSYMKNTCIGFSTSMINKTVTGDFYLSEMRLRQDTHLWISLLIQDLKIEGLPEELVKYRIREHQISGNKLRSAIRTLKLYWSFKEIPWKNRLFNFAYYSINGTLKRLSK